MEFLTHTHTHTQGETGRLASELSTSGQGRKEVVESCIKKVSNNV